MSVLNPPVTDAREHPVEAARATYVRFLQGVFHSLPVGSMHWEQDEPTEIVITADLPVVLTTIGKRPFIAVSHSPVSFASLGIEDRSAYSFQSGKHAKEILLPGVFVLSCCSRVYVESSKIAWICAEQSWMHRELLRSNGFLDIARGTQVSPAMPVGDPQVGATPDDWFSSVVQVPFQLLRESTYHPIDVPQLHEVGVKTSLASQPNTRYFMHAETGRVLPAAPVRVRERQK